MRYGENSQCSSVRGLYVKVENPISHLPDISNLDSPFSRRIHTTAAWEANQHQPAVTLPPIHELDLNSPLDFSDTRRSSIASSISVATQRLPSPPTVSQLPSGESPRNTRAQLHALQRRRQNRPRALSLTPDSGCDCDSGTEFSPLLRQRAHKAAREKTSRFGLNTGLGGLHNGLFDVNPDFPKIARRGPGKIGLTPLKSNNLHRGVRQSEHRHDLLQYNKIDIVELAKVVIEDDAALLKLFLAYMKTIGKPGSLAPAEAHNLFEQAVKTRGCESFDLEQLTNVISGLPLNRVSARL